MSFSSEPVDSLSSSLEASTLLIKFWERVSLPQLSFPPCIWSKTEPPLVVACNFTSAVASESKGPDKTFRAAPQSHFIQERNPNREMEVFGSHFCFVVFFLYSCG